MKFTNLKTAPATFYDYSSKTFLKATISAGVPTTIITVSVRIPHFGQFNHFNFVLGQFSLILERSS